MQLLRTFMRVHPVVRLLLLGTILMRTARTMSIPFLAIYIHQTTGAAPGTIGLVVGVGFLTNTVGGIVAGPVCDRLSRKYVMLVALVVWMFAFMSFGMARTAELFLLINAVSGFCGSFFELSSKTLMSELSDKDTRAQIYSMRYFCINIGVSIGPVLGAFFGIAATPAPFYVTAALYFVYGCVLLVKLPRSMVLQGTGKGKSFHLTTVVTTLARDNSLRFYLAGGIVWMFCYSQMDSTLIQVVNHSVSQGIKLYSLLLFVNSVTVVALQLPLTQLFKRLSPMGHMSIGFGLFAIGNFGFAVSVSWTEFILSMFVFAVGEILVAPATNTLVDEIAPTGLAGTYFGAMNMYNIGQFLGPWIGGILLNHAGRQYVFGAVSVLSLFGLLNYWAGRRKFFAQTLINGRNQTL